MFDKKDYSKLTLEELIIEEQKTKQKSSHLLVIAGIAVCITLYAIFKHSANFIHTLLPLMSAYIIHRNTENLKKNQAEIKSKTSI